MAAVVSPGTDVLGHLRAVVEEVEVVDVEEENQGEEEGEEGMEMLIVQVLVEDPGDGSVV